MIKITGFSMQHAVITCVLQSIFEIHLASRVSVVSYLSHIMESPLYLYSGLNGRPETQHFFLRGALSFAFNVSFFIGC